VPGKSSQCVAQKVVCLGKVVNGGLRRSTSTANKVLIFYWVRELVSFWSKLLSCTGLFGFRVRSRVPKSTVLLGRASEGVAHRTIVEER
jgi:hypothetical protein